MTKKIGIRFTRDEWLDIVRAIDKARDELCVGPNFPEARAFDNSLHEITQRITAAIAITR